MSEGKWRETVGAGFGTGRNKGQTRKHDVVHDKDGTVGGHHIEHWDGRQDAVIKVKPINAKVGLNGERIK